MARTFSGILMAGLLLVGMGVARLEAQRSGGRSPQNRAGNATQPSNNSSDAATGNTTQPAPPTSYAPPPQDPAQQTPTVRRPSPAITTPQNAQQIGTQQNQNKPVTPPNPRVAAVTTPTVTTGIPGRPVTPAANGVMPAQSGGFIGPLLPPPPPPLPPEKQPPTPPKVSFQDGLLTIESTNSRLGDILSSVRNKAGIQFEGMDSGVERVAAKLGPAPPDEVLSTLLQGSRFDYVILGHSGDPHSVERVLLSARGGAAPAMGGNAAPTKPQPNEEEAEEAATEEQPPPELPPDNQAQVPQVPPQSLTPASIPSGVPTPEQMLERIKEQQQKNQQQGPPTPTGTAPIKRQIPQ
jgi:hypothetical protein